MQQLPLEFSYLPSMGKEDFMVAKCNLEAATLIEDWPNWPYFAVCIYGSEGCGKTHLANVFAATVAARTKYPYKIPFIRANQIELETVHKLFEQNKCLVVEDLTPEINCEALFHLYNLYRDEGGNILFTANQAPARMKFKLPDLQSRLNIVTSIEIKEPDDDLLSSLLIKMFMDRQVMVNPEIINYMVANMQRSFAYARKLVAEIDNISLAKKRAVSVPIVKEAIASLAADTQGELF